MTLHLKYKQTWIGMSGDGINVLNFNSAEVNLHPMCAEKHISHILQIKVKERKKECSKK